ncbi:MAG TPA: 2Fe-2S iron-sulfur cluster-binding protein [Acidimicrobiales bacterium]|nr:2Fe-2S iron-sulfur cluster-binding protein [Acidimicrobiales bacterium]
MAIGIEVNGRAVEVADDGASLLDVLRDRLGERSVKDGCSPQGQCGCCTVLVDGSPRVACVTPVRRVAGRRITTLDGLPEVERRSWAEAFVATGASQCGFCTPGIIVRLAALAARTGAGADAPAVERALAAHLCRCTGWRTILEAWDARAAGVAGTGGRDLVAAAVRAGIEGGAPQDVGPEVALGGGGFADDTAPDGCLVAVPGVGGGWAVGESLAEARLAAGKVQGRRSPIDLVHPLEVPAGDWAATLRTTWVEPAYLEVDASWCEPGGAPASPLANGGAFGGKAASVAPEAAARLAAEHGRAVRVVLSREDTVRLGDKRPPMALGVRADGSGAVRVVRTPGVAAALAEAAPGWTVEEVDVAGPPTSTALRAVGWAEVAVLRAGLAGERDVTVVAPSGARATARVADDGDVHVQVDAGAVLDEVVLRSYCVGAAHMALGWARSEGIAVDVDGVVHDLTIRSFGVLRASETPPIHVEVVAGDGPPVNGSDAVFAAVAGAEWVRQGCPGAWPHVGTGGVRGA